MILLTLILFIGVLGLSVIKKYNRKVDSGKKAVTLQEACFYDLKTNKICLRNYANSDKLIIIAFHPECDICHYHIKSLIHHIDHFKMYRIVMITPCQDPEEVNEFSNQYGLNAIKSITILIDKNDELNKKFGISSWPVTLVYHRKKLVNRFYGEFKAESMANQLNMK